MSHGNCKEVDYSKDIRVVRSYRRVMFKNPKYKGWWLDVICGKCGEEFSCPQRDYLDRGRKNCIECNRIVDLSGKVFGKLTVQNDSHMRGTHRYWGCLCECGTYLYVRSSGIRNRKSCGCLARFKKGDRVTHGMSSTRTYRIWSGMRDRATNPNNQRYSDYLGRGISLEDRWNKFENFYEDMGEAPEGLTLGRINNNLGYSKENCRWETEHEQMSNRRSRTNTSGRVGVTWCKNTNKFAVSLTSKGKHYWGGRYSDIEEAKIKISELEMEVLGFTREVGFIKDE